jgi:23S rRNA pseudouridine2605 synthase
MTRRRRGEVSLERALSKLGIASRREAHELIVAGRVRVDGRVMHDPGYAVIPERIKIEVDGAAQRPTSWCTLMMNKPAGTLVTRRDPEGRPTVYELLPEGIPRVDAVGRLDLASTGLLLLTSQTQLANWLTAPSSGIVRRYHVIVRGALGDDALARLIAGIEDRAEWLRAESIELLKRSSRETSLLLDLTEGKNREIRRLLAAVGTEATRLKRIAFGALELGTLRPGRVRLLDRAELRLAFPNAPERGLR